MAIAGGEPALVCRVEGVASAASWGAGDVIVFASTATLGLWRVRASGGTAEILTRPTDDIAHVEPRILPGGRAVAFGTLAVFGGTSRIGIAALETGKIEWLFEGSSPRYAASGHLLFSDNGSLMAVPFDSVRLLPVGAPIRLKESVSGRSGFTREFEVSNGGTLLYSGRGWHQGPNRCGPRRKAAGHPTGLHPVRRPALVPRWPTVAVWGRARHLDL